MKRGGRCGGAFPGRMCDAGHLRRHTVLVWYLVEPGRLSPAANAALDKAVDAGEVIYVSAVSLVELVYLVEKGRLPRGR